MVSLRPSAALLDAALVLQDLNTLMLILAAHTLLWGFCVAINKVVTFT